MSSQMIDVSVSLDGRRLYAMVIPLTDLDDGPLTLQLAKVAHPEVPNPNVASYEGAFSLALERRQP